MTTPISAAAAQAREGARQADGQFGVQPRIEVSDVHLADDFPKVGPSHQDTHALARITDLANDWADRVQVADAVHAALVSVRESGGHDDQVRYLALNSLQYDYEPVSYQATILDAGADEVGYSQVPGYTFRNGEDQVPEAFRPDPDDDIAEAAFAHGENQDATSIIDVRKVLTYPWSEATAQQRSEIAQLASGQQATPDELVVTPETVFRVNRKAVVDAVADYDMDPTEDNLWKLKTATLALESTLADSDIPDDRWNELRQARKRAKNTPAGMTRLRSAIDGVTAWGEAVYGC